MGGIHHPVYGSREAYTTLCTVAGRHIHHCSQLDGRHIHHCSQLDGRHAWYIPPGYGGWEACLVYTTRVWWEVYPTLLYASLPPFVGRSGGLCAVCVPPSRAVYRVCATRVFTLLTSVLKRGGLPGPESVPLPLRINLLPGRNRGIRPKKPATESTSA